jgi:hypothetical protein
MNNPKHCLSEKGKAKVSKVAEYFLTHSTHPNCYRTYLELSHDIPEGAQIQSQTPSYMWAIQSPKGTCE